MRFAPTAIDGVVTVDIEPASDERGFFARLYCPQEFEAAGYPFAPVQSSLSHNAQSGTLRGMHFQTPPHSEVKLVRVTRGRAFDVALDLREDSPTHRRWTAAELSADNGRALLIPHGVAHGFLTLEADTDVVYQIDRMYQPGHDAGVRWDDPAFAIAWPQPPRLISPRDAAYASYDR